MESSSRPWPWPWASGLACRRRELGLFPQRPALGERLQPWALTVLGTCKEARRAFPAVPPPCQGLGPRGMFPAGGCLSLPVLA